MERWRGNFPRSERGGYAQLPACDNMPLYEKALEKADPKVLDEIDTLVGRWASEREAGEAFGDFVIRAGIVRPVIDSARDFYD